MNCGESELNCSGVESVAFVSGWEELSWRFWSFQREYWLTL